MLNFCDVVLIVTWITPLTFDVEGSAGGPSCSFDCFKETICNLSSPSFLLEAIDIGLINSTNEWLYNRYPAYNYTCYIDDACKRNRVRSLLASAFYQSSPEEILGCAVNGLCNGDECRDTLKNVSSSNVSDNDPRDDKHRFETQRLKTIFQLMRSIMNYDEDLSQNQSYALVEMKHFDAHRNQLPNKPDPICPTQREYPTTERVHLLLSVTKNMYQCNTGQHLVNSQDHSQNASLHDDLIRLDTLNHFIQLTVKKQASHPISHLKKKCGRFSDDLYISKAMMAKNIGIILMHCGNCSIQQNAGDIFSNSTGCTEQARYLNMEAHLSTVRAIASTLHKAFDCSYHEGRCKFVSRTSINAIYRRIRSHLQCIKCDNNSEIQHHGSRMDPTPSLQPSTIAVLHAITDIAKETMECDIDSNTVHRGDLERGLENLIGFHRVLLENSWMSLNHLVTWPNCSSICNPTVMSTSIKCEACNTLAMSRAVSAVTTMMLNCSKTFTFLGQQFCMPSELRKEYDNCLVNYADVDHPYTARGKDLLSLIVAVTSIIGCDNHQFGNIFAFTEAKCAYLNAVLQQNTSAIVRRINYPNWILSSRPFQIPANNRDVFERLYKIQGCSQSCLPWEEYCSDMKHCMPAYLNCKAIQELPIDRMYPLIGHVDTTSLWSTAFYLSDFSNESIIVTKTSSGANTGFWTAYLQSGQRFDLRNITSGLVLGPKSLLKFHSKREGSHGVRILQYYLASDIFRMNNSDHVTTSNSSNTTDEIDDDLQNSTQFSIHDGQFVNLSDAKTNPRKAVLLINPVSRIENLRLKANIPNVYVMEDSRDTQAGQGIRARDFLAFHKAMNADDQIPHEMYPFIPRHALDLYYQFVQAFRQSQPMIKVLATGAQGHWHARYSDGTNKTRMMRLVTGNIFPVADSEMFFHPAPNFNGITRLHLNVCYCHMMMHQHDYAVALDIQVTVLPVNDRPIARINMIMLPTIPYNFSIIPNHGFSISALQWYVSDIDSLVHGIAILAAAHTKIGEWYYMLGNSTWQQLFTSRKMEHSNSQGFVDIVRLRPEDKLQFRVTDSSTQWSLATALRQVWLRIRFWDLADNKTNGLDRVAIHDIISSTSYSSEVFCYMARQGCDGKLGSLARRDVCGVCGGNGRACTGCDGVAFSGAKFDSCGQCTGGSTGKVPNFLRDCAGTCGKAELDDCNICQKKGNQAGRRSFKDCMGVCFGRARRNKCGTCFGGSSNLNATSGLDVCGICNGDGSRCTGCDGIANSGKQRDACGSCLHPTDSSYNANCTIIVDFVPKSSPSVGGREIQISGAGFSLYSIAKCYFQRGATRISASYIRLGQANRSSFKLLTPAALPGSYSLKCTFNNNAKTFQASPPIFKFYSKSTITVASTDISIILVNKLTNITINGAGFNQTDEIFCAVRSGHRPDIIKGRIINATSAKCQLPKFPKSTQLQLTIIGSREDATMRALNTLPANAWLELTVQAAAPLPTTAQLSGNLEWILVTFDRNIEINSKQCSEILSANVSAKLGINSRCYLRKLNQLIIKLGRESSLSPGHTLHFKQAAIKPRNEKYFGSQDSSVILQHPNSLESLHVLVYGRSVIDSCEALRIKAVASGNTGSKKLSFSWNVDFATDVDNSSLTQNDTDDLQRIKSYLAGLHSHSHYIHIAASNMLISTSSKYLGYEFKVMATNYMGQQSNATSLIVERVDTSVPTVKIFGGAKRKSKAFKNLVIHGYARRSPCLQLAGKSFILYRWEVSAADIKLDTRSKETPRLFVRRGTLKGGYTYTFTLTASMASDPSRFASASVEVNVESSPLVAKVEGGSNRVIGSDSDIVLDASNSYDPDKDTIVAESFLWECYDSSTSPCFVPEQNNTGRMKRLVLPSVKRLILAQGTLPSNETYSFIFTFNKGPRSASKTINIRIDTGSPPLVFIRPQRHAKANSNRKTVIRGYVKTRYHNTNAWWECAEESGFSYLDLSLPGIARTRTRKIIKRRGTSLFILVLNKNVLEHGSAYKFKLCSSNVNGEGFAETVITVNGPPSLGTFTTDLSQGIALQTEFTLRALDGWIDDAEDLPLKYNFGYIKLDGKEAYLGSATLDNEVTSYLPAGNPRNNFTLSLFVDVSDNKRSIRRALHSVQVRPLAELSIESMNSFAQKIEIGFAANDLSSVIGQITSTVNVLNDASHSVDLAGVASTIVNMTTGIHEEIVKFKENMTNGVLDMLSSVLDRETQDIVINLMSDLTKDGRLFGNLLKRKLVQSIATLVKEQLNGESNVPSSALMEKRKRETPRGLEIAALEADENNDDDDDVAKTPEEVEKVMETFENVINTSLTDNTTMTMKREFTNLIPSLLVSLCKNSAYGENATISQSKLSMLQTYKNDFSDGENTSISLDCANCGDEYKNTAIFNLGNDLTSKYQSWQCTADYTCNGVCLGSVQMTEDLFSSRKENATLVSEVVQVNLFNPETSAALTENQLISPMTTLIPLNGQKFNRSHALECRYWDGISESWKNDSCWTEGNTTMIGNSTYVVCKCTRTGTIAAFEGPLFQKQTADTSSTTVTTANPNNAVTISSHAEKNELSLAVYLLVGAVAIIQRR